MENFELENGKIIQVADNDLKYISLKDALKHCEGLSGWRLPSIEELEQIYNRMHKSAKGKFEESFYWSNNKTETINGLEYGMGFGFSSGKRMQNSIAFQGKARLVKDLNPSIITPKKIMWKGVRTTKRGDEWEIMPLEYNAGSLYCKADDENGEFEVSGSITRSKIILEKKYVNGKVVRFEAISNDDGSYFEGQWTSDDGSGKFDMFKPLAVELD